MTRGKVSAKLLILLATEDVSSQSSHSSLIK
jgi:hypothetical protein